MHDLKDGQQPIISGPVQNERTHLFLLAGVVFLALFLRIWNLAGQSLEWDDYNGLVGLAGGDLLETLGLSRLLNPEGAPLYHIVQYFAQFFVGRGEMALRGLSVFFGVLSIPVLFAAGRRLFGSGAALFAAFLFALSPHQIFHDQSVRNYPLSVLMALCALYSFICFLERGEEFWLAVNVLFGTLLVWTHLLGAMFLLAQGLAMLFAGRKWLKWTVLWAVAQGIMVLPMLFWIWTLPPIPDSAYWVFHAPGLGGLVSGVLGFDSLLLNREIAPPASDWMFSLPGGGILDLTPVGVVSSAVMFTIFAVSIIRGFVHMAGGRFRNHPAGTPVLLFFMLVPPLALALLSHVWRPIFFNRYFLFATPAAYLLAGALCFKPGRRVVGAGCALLLASAYTTHAFVAVQGSARTHWKQAGWHLLEKAGPEDQILVGGVGDAYANLGILSANMPPNGLAIAPAHTIDAAVVKALWHLHECAVSGKPGKAGFVTNLLWEDRLAERLEGQLRLAGLEFSRVDFPANERICVWWITLPPLDPMPLKDALEAVRRTPPLLGEGVDFAEVLKRLPPGTDLERAYWALRMIQDDGEWPADGSELLLRLAVDCQNEGFADISAALRRAYAGEVSGAEGALAILLIEWRAAMLGMDAGGAADALKKLRALAAAPDGNLGSFLYAAEALSAGMAGNTKEAARALARLDESAPKMFSRMLPLIRRVAENDQPGARREAALLRALVPEGSWPAFMLWKSCGLEAWLCPSGMAVTALRPPMP